MPQFHIYKPESLPLHMIDVPEGIVNCFYIFVFEKAVTMPVIKLAVKLYQAFIHCYNFLLLLCEYICCLHKNDM
jgi:hypothetical protein